MKIEKGFKYIQNITTTESLQNLTSGYVSDRACDTEVIDPTKPMDILEEEELERISALLQRDNLVRGLGIVEHVYRLLHCTPGTMGIQPKTDNHRHYVRRFHVMSQLLMEKHTQFHLMVKNK